MQQPSQSNWRENSEFWERYIQQSAYEESCLHDENVILTQGAHYCETLLMK
jgi:hypothetical protein